MTVARSRVSPSILTASAALAKPAPIDCAISSPVTGLSNDLVFPSGRVMVGMLDLELSGGQVRERGRTGGALHIPGTGRRRRESHACAENALLRRRRSKPIPSPG